jgi:hypothetical protein
MDLAALPLMNLYTIFANLYANILGGARHEYRRKLSIMIERELQRAARRITEPLSFFQEMKGRLFIVFSLLPPPPRVMTSQLVPSHD